MSILIKSIETNNVRGRNVILFADLKSEVPTTGAATIAAIGEDVKLNAGDVIYTAALEAAILDTNDEWDWDFGGGGSGGVSSVNGQTGTVVLDADDVGATPETVLVTVTGSVNDSCTADMTFAEISAAYAAGNRLKVVFPISSVFGITASLEPIKWGGTVIMFGAVAIASDSTIHMVQCTISNSNAVSVTSTQIAEWGDIPLSSNDTPRALGAAFEGSSTKYSRSDHVHQMPTVADIGAEPAVIEYTITDSGAVATFLEAGKIYHFTGSLTSLTISLSSTQRVPQYHFDFVEGSTAFDPVLPASVVLPDGWTWAADTRYEVDILNGYAVIVGWAVSA